MELLKHFQYRQLVFIHASDTDGRSLLGWSLFLSLSLPDIRIKQLWCFAGRFQTKAQDLDVDDHEVKVQTQRIIFFLLSLQYKKSLAIAIRRKAKFEGQSPDERKIQIT